MNTFAISAEPLNLETIEQILGNNTKLILSDEAKNKIQHCRDYLDSKLENHSEPIYGITTGFGSLCNIQISAKDLSKLQENLVMSHACGTGNAVSDDIVRLMLMLKAHALS
ncbi:MAG TPA: histidine ammonia-lyase, partial [Bacteroidales bacterium]|nr:histidine ammonia-lyase [Bacteroidales bacterium]